MNDAKLAVMDQGEVNRRILGNEQYQVDFRRVEAASIKRNLHLSSGEAKRIFARCFYSFQASLYFVSQIGRTRLPGEAVENIEKIIRDKIDEVAKELNTGIDSAEALLKNNNVEDIASYDILPLDMLVPITSALGRRYFETIHQLDLLMPLLQTLAIEEIISDKQADRQRSRYKRIVMSVKSTTMNWSFKVRKLMYADDAAHAVGNASVTPRLAVVRDITPQLPDVVADDLQTVKTAAEAAEAHAPGDARVSEPVAAAAAESAA